MQPYKATDVSSEGACVESSDMLKITYNLLTEHGLGPL